MVQHSWVSRGYCFNQKKLWHVAKHDMWHFHFPNELVLLDVPLARILFFITDSTLDRPLMPRQGKLWKRLLMRSSKSIRVIESMLRARQQFDFGAPTLPLGFLRQQPQHFGRSDSRNNHQVLEYERKDIAVKKNVHSLPSMPSMHS